MSRIAVRQRWLPVPWGVYGIILALLFGGIGAYFWLHPEDGPTVLMVVPLYAISVYMVLAAVCNVYQAVVTPHRIWEFVWPFPVRLPRATSRDRIRHCYLRNVNISDDTAEWENHYYAGVETVEGWQIELSGPHQSAEHALQMAYRVADVLNEAPGPNQISVVRVPQLRSRGEAIRIVLICLFWLALSIYGVFLGADWDEEYRRKRRDAAR